MERPRRDRARPVASAARRPRPVDQTPPTGSNPGDRRPAPRRRPPRWSGMPRGRASLPVRLSTGPEQPRVRMRQRIARFGSRQPQAPVLDPLFKVIRANHPKADLSLIERAYRTAERYHRGQTRRSGDAYITHPLAVTTILAELGLTEPTLCAALLHDTVEDTSYTLAAADPRLRRGGRPPGRRLHEARQGQVRRVGQVGDHPQDGRRDEPRHPGAGDQARRPAAQHAHAALPAARQAVPDRVRDAGDLRPAGPPAGHERDQVGARGPVLRGHAAEGLRRDRPDGRRGRSPPGRVPVPGDRAGDRRPARPPRSAPVTGRPKHYYSIYQKMVVRGRDFADIFDLVGLRVLVDTTATATRPSG